MSGPKFLEWQRNQRVRCKKTFENCFRVSGSKLNVSESELKNGIISMQTFRFLSETFSIGLLFSIFQTVISDRFLASVIICVEYFDVFHTQRPE